MARWRRICVDLDEADKVLGWSVWRFTFGDDAPHEVSTTSVAPEGLSPWQAFARGLDDDFDQERLPFP